METQVASFAAPDPSGELPAHPAGWPSLDVVGNAAALRLFIPARIAQWDDDPISKGRPRARVQNPGSPKAFAQIYTDPRTREWEEWVETAVRIEMGILESHPDNQILRLPFQGRVLMSCRFNLTRPKSLKKSVTLPLTARGDVDNMAKAIMDAFQNAGVISNDRIVTDLMTYRRFADDEHPVGVEVDLTGLH